MKLPLFNPDDKYKGSPTDNFKYNGKEYMADLGYYEYGFRIYDPTTARFTAVDPLAMDYAYKSTYDYAENSPILYIDMDGLEKYNANRLLNAATNKNVISPLNRANLAADKAFKIELSAGLGLGLNTPLFSVEGKVVKQAFSYSGNGTLRSNTSMLSVGANTNTPIVQAGGKYTAAEFEFATNEMLSDYNYREDLNKIDYGLSIGYSDGNGQSIGVDNGDAEYGVMLGLIGAKIKANIIEAGKAIDETGIALMNFLQNLADTYVPLIQEEE